MRILDDPSTRMQSDAFFPAPVTPYVPEKRAPRPQPPVPAMQMRPNQQAPQGSPLGLGALGGSNEGGGGSNFLQALGHSLMTSPSNSPLSGFPGAFQALQVASVQQQKTAEQRQAIESVLIHNGIDPEMARVWANDPAAARMGLDQMQRQFDNSMKMEEVQQDGAFRQSLEGGMVPVQGGGQAQLPFGDGGQAQVSNARSPATSPSDLALVQRRAMPTFEQAESGNVPQRGMGDPNITYEGAQQALAQARQSEQPQQPPTESLAPRDQLEQMHAERQLEQLRTRRQQYERLIPQARNSHQLAQVRSIIDGLDNQIAELSPKAIPEMERRIRDLEARGIDRADAEDVIYGISQVVVDPDLQTPMLVNRITGETRALMAEGPPMSDRAATEGGTLWDTVGTSTGVIPALQETWTNIAPQLGFPEVPGVVEDRQQFQVATRELVRALSINPRFPVGEMERIEREIDISPSMLRSPEALHQKMRAVDSGLRRRLENETRAAQDPYLPAEQRRNARVAANDIRNFLAVLGVPQGDETRAPQSIAPAPQREEITPPPLDFPEPELWEFLSPEERELWQ